MSKSPYCLRSSRYSGSERPAWRMNQTGVRSTGSRRQARTSSGSDTALSLAFAGSVHGRQLPGPAEPDRARGARVLAEDRQLERALGEPELGAAVAAADADV